MICFNKVAKNGSPTQLLELHRQIESDAKQYDVDFDVVFKNVPSKSALQFRHFKKANVSFCVPPRSGSTNWLRTLTPISDYPERQSVYSRHPTLTKSAVRQQKDIQVKKVYTEQLLNWNKRNMMPF